MDLPLTLGSEGNRWTVGVDGDTMWTEWGRLGGKQQRSVRTYASGKQGRTAHEQAVFEAESAARKKLRLGYSPLAHGAVPPEPEHAAGPPLPMLASDWAKYKRPERWVDSVILLQPKLDGIRCVADTVSGALYSRTGKPFTGLPHLGAALRLAAEVAAPPARWIDGEIFCPGMGFQSIVAAARTSEASAASAALQLHVFDIVSDLPCSERCEQYRQWLTAAHGLVSPGTLACILPVATETVPPQPDVPSVEAVLGRARARFEAQGYEGAIARLGRGAYVPRKRSLELVKTKSFRQEEFVVRGVEERAKQPGVAAAVVCVTAAGHEFRATPETSAASKREMWADRRRYTDGSWLAAVRFQEYTDKGVPRFPVCVGLRHRDDC